MDEKSDVQQNIMVAVTILAESQYAIGFTGAGISTPSGIPDFRSPETGLWVRGEIPQTSTIHAFSTDPSGFYEWFYPMVKRFLSAEPNPAHKALANLEAVGILKALITQNADMLHQRAGSQSVLEIHGTIASMTCIRCYRIYPGSVILERFLGDREVPHCQDCGGVLKPNVIMAGEQLPSVVMVDARRKCEECDVILVAGTSISGGPASDLPEIAIRFGARLILVNQAPTPLDLKADVLFQGDVAIILPAIAAALQGDVG